MRQTKTTIKELTARYRKVLLKCALINAAFFMTVGTAKAEEEIQPTINVLKESATDYLNNEHKNYVLATEKGEHTAQIVINGTTYYFTPDESSPELNDAVVNLANIGATALIAGTASDYTFFVPAPAGYFKYDPAKLPSSVYSYSDSGSGITAVTFDSSQYQVISQTSFGSGGETYSFTINEVPINAHYASPSLIRQVIESNADNVSGDFYNISGDTMGGAISFTSTAGAYTIGSVNSDFIANYTTDGQGGAIYNFTNTIGTISGDFIDNYAVSTADDALTAYGGAIVNQGGAEGTGKIGLISGNFVRNHVDLSASAAAENTKVYGGAIFNWDVAEIGTISANFIANYAKANPEKENQNVAGGAIANFSESSSGARIGNITGDFIKNNIQNGNSKAYGGAIYNQSVIGNITGDFIANTITRAGGEGYGGAIYNDGTLGTVTGDFVENYVKNSAAGKAYGGAVYNNGTIGAITGSFIGNHAQTSAGEGTDAHGGAIYTNSSLNFVADNTSMVFSGNYISKDDGGTKAYEAIYASSASAALTFSIKNEGEATLYDYINGVDGYSVNFTGDETGTLYLFNDIKNAAVTLDKVKLNLQNNEIKEYDAFKSLTLNSDIPLSLDVDLEGVGAADKLSAMNVDANDHFLIIDSIKFSGAMGGASTTIPVVGDTLKDYVKLSTDDLTVTGLGTGNKYLIAYVKDAEGVLNVKTGAEATLASAVASTASERAYVLGDSEDIEQNLGAMGGTALHIFKTGGGIVTINGQTHAGITVGGGQSLSIKDVLFANFSTVITNQGTLSLTNVQINSENAIGINNGGTLKLNGEVIIDTSIIDTAGTGKTEIAADSNNNVSAALTQNTLTVATGASFTAGTVTVTNGGSIAANASISGDMVVKGGTFTVGENGSITGTIGVDPAATMTVDKGTLASVENKGTMLVKNASTIGGNLVNSGTIGLDSSSVTGNITNLGTMGIKDSASANVTNTGSFTVAGNFTGNLENRSQFSINGNVNFTGSIHNDASANMNVANTLTVSGGVTNDGTIKGGGTIAGNVTSSAQGTIGTSMTIGGTLTSAGNILLESNTTTPYAMTVDTLNITGGKLVLSSGNKTYQKGDVVTVINFDTLAGFSGFEPWTYLTDFVVAMPHQEADKITATIDFIPMSQEASTSSFTPDEHKIIQAIDDIYMNQGKADFGRFYFYTPQELKEQVNLLRSKAMPVLNEQLPLTKVMSSQVYAHLFTNSMVKDAGTLYHPHVPMQRFQGGYYRGRSGGSTLKNQKVWGQILGGVIKEDGDASVGRNDSTTRSVGVMFGYDHETSEKFMFGFTAGMASAKLSQDNNKVDLRDYRAGFYTASRFGRMTLNTLTMGGFQQYNTEKNMTLAGMETKNKADFNGYSAEFNVNLGYDFMKVPYRDYSFHIRSYLSADVSYLHQDAYKEKGSVISAIGLKAIDDTSVSVSPGITFGYTFSESVLTADIGYQRLLSGGSLHSSAYFAADETKTTFASFETEADKDFLNAGLGFKTKLTRDCQLNLWAGTRISDKTSSLNFAATFSYAF